jgi:hypothetical protein
VRRLACPGRSRRDAAFPPRKRPSRSWQHVANQSAIIRVTFPHSAFPSTFQPSKTSIRCDSIAFFAPLLLALLRTMLTRNNKRPSHQIGNKARTPCSSHSLALRTASWMNGPLATRSPDVAGSSNRNIPLLDTSLSSSKQRTSFFLIATHAPFSPWDSTRGINS